jgi:hypothetical protein|tara:strand:- start:2351 stop:2626 length:276 start_codon:yes stop_codon:yes gene_type:complete
MNYIVTYYKSNYKGTDSHNKPFVSSELAEEYFEEVMRKELKNELFGGHISDQEFQDILSNQFYNYETDNTEVNISIELFDDLFLTEDNDLQ